MKGVREASHVGDWYEGEASILNPQLTQWLDEASKV
jgi:hypothetical protein